MADIAIHHPIQEREGRCGKQCRVGLLIARNTIGIHKFLKGPGELVNLEVRWRDWPWLGDVFHHRSHIRVNGRSGAAHGIFNCGEGLGNCPALSTKEAPVKNLEEVEGMVNRLFAEQRPLPLLHILCQVAAQAVSGLPVFLQHLQRFFQLRSCLFLQSIGSTDFFKRRHMVAACPKGVTDFVDLLLNGCRLEEDNEHHLMHHFTGRWISNGLANLSKPNVTVAAGGSEQHALKPCAILLLHNP
mmetsp:Transcript_5610/g.7749  ORF Transcript_5610/g.7749 Transcript_5610/m.7749 type:complete len:243 (-) Transcript_5610:723-1451(-)